ncbi:MAG: hypothetical protein JRL30_20490 [Deltaproteobacteria bacterium]|nr:hypothetical protein [Deltaproteobacteria bacterium]
MSDQNFESDIFYRYYESQREEIHTRVKERMSMAFQMLIMAATATVAYTQMVTVGWLKIFLGVFIVALGAWGLFSNETQRQAINAHIKRAREARRNIVYINEIAKDIRVGVSAKEAKQYRWLHYLVMFYGCILAIAALWPFRSVLRGFLCG